MKKGTLLAVTAIVVGSAIGYRYKKELLKKIPTTNTLFSTSEVENIPVYIREAKTNGEGL